jgi:hypothetical protein
MPPSLTAVSWRSLYWLSISRASRPCHLEKSEIEGQEWAMKSAAFRIFLTAGLLLGLVPAKAAAPEDFVLYFLFSLDPQENSLMLRRMSETRWGIVSLDPSAMLTNPRDTGVSAISGQVEIVALDKEASSGQAAPPHLCKYKIKVFNENGAVKTIYDFDFSHVRDYSITTAGVVPVISAPIQSITISGPGLYTMHAIDMKTGQISSEESSSWHYGLPMTASIQSLTSAYQQFKSRFCAASL